MARREARKDKSLSGLRIAGCVVVFRGGARCGMCQYSEPHVLGREGLCVDKVVVQNVFVCGGAADTFDDGASACSSVREDVNCYRASV